MSEPLIIVDMQAQFGASKDVSRHVAGQIRKAMKAGEPIVFVEYEGYGLSLEHLRRIAKDYPLRSSVTKRRDDGSREVSAHLKAEYGLEAPASLRVVGVNTAACVAGTAEGLAYMGFKITIVEKGVTDSCGSCHTTQIEKWKNGGRPNVSVAA